MVKKVLKFITEVRVEMKQVAWLTKQELVDATWIVIISSLILGLYIGGADFALSKLLGVIIR